MYLQNKIYEFITHGFHFNSLTVYLKFKNLKMSKFEVYQIRSTKCKKMINKQKIQIYININ